MPEDEGVRTDQQTDQTSDDSSRDDVVPKSEYEQLKSQLDELKPIYEQFSELQKNPRFAEFLEEENRRLALGDEEYERIYGQKSSEQVASDEGPDLENMTEDERVEYLVEQKLAERLKPIEERLTEAQISKFQEDAQAELRRLETDKENFPLFNETITRDGVEVPVRELMRQELQKAVEAGSNLTMEQAYRIVTYDAQRELGRKEYEELLRKKREAAKLGIPVSSPGQPAVSAKKKFDNPRQAAEYALDELNL